MAVGVKRFSYDFEGAAISPVVIILLLFIFYCSPLDFKFFLRDALKKKAHSVGFEPKHGFQMVCGYGLEIVGSITVSCTIHRPARLSNDLNVLFIRDVF